LSIILDIIDLFEYYSRYYWFIYELYCI